MADSKETMSMEELDHVAGGNYNEILKDLRAFAAIGLITNDQVPANVDASNFSAMNRLAFETWQKVGVTMQGHEGVTNSYILPSTATATGAYGNTRSGALNYAKYQSGRGDLDISSYL